MSSFILAWVIIGAVCTLLFILFFVNIDSRLADRFTGYPLIYLLTVFFWPITVIWVLWKQLNPSELKR